MALKCLVFEKITFLQFGDRQTDEQMDTPVAWSHSRCHERQLNKWLIMRSKYFCCWSYTKDIRSRAPSLRQQSFMLSHHWWSRPTPDFNFQSGRLRSAECSAETRSSVERRDYHIRIRGSGHAKQRFIKDGS